MNGILRAISIESYGLYGEDKKLLFQFTVSSPKKRKKIDKLQGMRVNYDKDIKSLIK